MKSRRDYDPLLPLAPLAAILLIHIKRRGPSEIAEILGMDEALLRRLSKQVSQGRGRYVRQNDIRLHTADEIVVKLGMTLSDVWGDHPALWEDPPKEYPTLAQRRSGKQKTFRDKNGVVRYKSKEANRGNVPPQLRPFVFTSTPVKAA